MVGFRHDCVGLFFRHSPLTGANDEKSGESVDRYPGLRLLRSLTPGYHLSRLQRLNMEVFYGAKRLANVESWAFDLRNECGKDWEFS